MALHRVTRAVDRTLNDYVKRKQLGAHWAVTEKVAVCISASSQARDLIARGARLAEGLGGEFYRRPRAEPKGRRPRAQAYTGGEPALRRQSRRAHRPSDRQEHSLHHCGLRHGKSHHAGNLRPLRAARDCASIFTTWRFSGSCPRRRTSICTSSRRRPADAHPDRRRRAPDHARAAHLPAEQRLRGQRSRTTGWRHSSSSRRSRPISSSPTSPCRRWTASSSLAPSAASSETPIIVLSVREQETMKVAALDEGADDYMTKPFSMPELLARVRANLRKSVARGAGAAGDHRRRNLH